METITLIFNVLTWMIIMLTLAGLIGVTAFVALIVRRVMYLHSRSRGNPPFFPWALILGAGLLAGCGDDVSLSAQEMSRCREVAAAARETVPGDFLMILQPNARGTYVVQVPHVHMPRSETELPVYALRVEGEDISFDDLGTGFTLIDLEEDCELLSKILVVRFQDYEWGAIAQEILADFPGPL